MPFEDSRHTIKQHEERVSCAECGFFVPIPKLVRESSPSVVQLYRLYATGEVLDNTCASQHTDKMSSNDSHSDVATSGHTSIGANNVSVTANGAVSDKQVKEAYDKVVKEANRLKR